MVEPVSAAVIATLIATKAFEKTGDKLGEGVWALVSKFLSTLKRKDPATAAAIAQVAQTAALAEQQAQTYGTAALMAKVEEAAKTDVEVQQAAAAIQTAVQAQPGAIVNLTKLAEKIGVLNQHTVIDQTNNLSF